MGLDFSASAEIGIRKALATPRMKDVKKRFFKESGSEVKLFTRARVNEKRENGSKSVEIGSVKKKSLRTETRICTGISAQKGL